MATQMIRRNGKLPSCEKCRLSKLRCDHQKPCGRCLKKGIGNTCFYHPAPLARPREERQQAALKKRTRKASANKIATDQSREKSVRSPSHNNSSGTSPGTSPEVPSNSTFDAGFLGPTSYAAAFAADPNTGSRSCEQWRHRPHDVASRPTTDRWKTHPDRVKTVAKTLGYFDHFELMETLIKRYYLRSQFAVVAGPLVINALSALKKTVDELRTNNSDQNAELILNILHNTTQPLGIDASTAAVTFHNLFTGLNLRLEFIGFIMALAGSCASRDNMNDNRGFVDKMCKGSNACVALCEQSGSVNDISVWLIYQDAVFMSVLHGDSSHAFWRRLGNLSSEVIAMGLHREPKEANKLPFFLLECRRRIFGAVYRLDKSLSTFLGRPCKISHRYSDCRLPLDLKDEVLMMDGLTRDSALKFVNAEGWNLDCVPRPAAWCRLRQIMGVFREKILDYSLTTYPFGTDDELHDLSKECRHAWEALPSYLQYDPGCWDTDQSSNHCLMLTNAYLEYLNTEYHIQAFLQRRSSDPCQSPAFLGIASHLVTTVMILAKQHDRLPDIGKNNLSWIILFYGFPSAGVLASALQTYMKMGSRLPGTISRTEIIRNLSVFISCLESVAKPGEGNYSLCNRALQMLEHNLEDVLDPKPAQHTDLDQPFPDLTEFGSLDFGSAELFNLFEGIDVDWSMNMDDSQFVLEG